MPSKVTYWKLTTPLAFEGKAGLIDSLRIVRIQDLNLKDATIIYAEGWVLTNTAGVVTEIRPIGGIKSWCWRDNSYLAAVSQVPSPGVTRQQDLIALFYAQLGALKPEYAGTLIVQDTP